MNPHHDPTTPYWSESPAPVAATPLTGDASADVVVVGGGITGLTSAYLLAKAGKRVVLLERRRCGSADTGHTTAHLTMVTDARISDLQRKFGRDHAQAVWDAGLAAIGQIDALVRELGIDAGFEWIEGYLHAPLVDDRGDHADGLRKDAAVARELGFDAEYLDAVPFMARPGVRFDGQARFHPRRYLAGVARAFLDLGGRIFEESEASEFATDPLSVKVGGHTVTCEDVVIATHNPLVGVRGFAGATLFQTKLALYSSYAVAGRVARGTTPDALWWDTASPYAYLRVDPHGDHDVLIFGGEDHKTGQEADTTGCHRRLEEGLVRMVPGIEVTHRWSGQVIETPDGLPYIGQTAEHQYAATGFAGNGMTFGTLAGMMLSDAILGRSNPWADLFAPGRKALTRGVWDYLTENVDYPYYMIRGRFAGAEARSVRAVKRGHGMVVERNGAKVAAYRDPSGAVSLCSAICTHMGCVVTWNPAERTWDCPCHGSRFTPSGEVLAGPAEAPLAKVE